MKLIDLFAAALGLPAAAIRDMLTAGATALGPELNSGLLQLIAKFEQAVTPDSVAALMTAIPPEAAAIFAGHFNPRRHPSDAS